MSTVMKTILLIVMLLLVVGCSRHVVQQTKPSDSAKSGPAVIEDPSYYGDQGSSPTYGRKVIVQSPDLRIIYFDYDRYDLRADQRPTLAHNVEAVRPGEIIIEGHCDERGTIEYNLALGQRRANTVRDYIMMNAGTQVMIQTISYGKERPIDSGHDEVAWAKNRRVEISQE